MNQAIITQTQFHALADGALSAIETDFEDADQEGLLEVEATTGMVTLTLPDGKQFVVSKHAPTCQLWLSSPVSGAHHFRGDAEGGRWTLEDGRELRALLDAELAALLGTEG